MSFTKTIVTVAATAAIAVGAAFAGSAPAAAGETRIITRDTWAPGFRNNGGAYERIVQAERDDTPREITRLETSTTWAAGFRAAGEGGYERLVTTTRLPRDGNTSIASRATWAPGYFNDMNAYRRIVPNGGDASQTAILPGEAQ